MWQALEAQNADWFYGYNVKLRLRDQLTAFNYLVHVGEERGAGGVLKCTRERCYVDASRDRSPRLYL